MYKELHQELVKSTISYIETNLRNPMTVEDVCKQVAMSPWQFQRVFRFLVGTSIGHYLRGRRLSEAFQVLLQESHRSIVDLAFEYQFNSHEAFTRSFKSFFGCLPSEARNRQDLFELKRKLAIDEGKMEVVWASIQDISHVSSVGPFDLIGIQREVESPFSVQSDFENETLNVWKEFYQKIKSAPRSENFSPFAYGVALNTKTELISAKLNYFASKVRDEFSQLPEAFHEFQLPRNDYAIFTISGSLQQLQTLVDYIYAIWLPASKFSRGLGYDFEKFESKLQVQDGMYFYSYHLPIAKKNS